MKLHGGALALYIFDNFPNHHKTATYALNTKKLNFKDGGKNTHILRYGLYIDQNGHRDVHTMQTAEGFQKGLKTILLERGLWRYGMKKDDALDLLLQQDYFDPTKLSSILDETVKRLGVWLELVHKYHPEFNFIEMCWGYYKRKVITECEHEWESLLLQVPEALNSVPLLFMKRAYTKCCRYINGYRIVLNARHLYFATKKYTYHCIISPAYIDDKELWELR